MAPRTLRKRYSWVLEDLPLKEEEKEFTITC
jgi:hypothetical protein